MTEKKIKWCAVQPLIGGMALGFAEAIGTKPEFIASFPCSKDNDKHLQKYWPDVPYLTIDPEGFFPSAKDQAIFDSLKEGIDIVPAVPVCSGLSMLNSSQNGASDKSRGSDAAQNQNMYDIANWALKEIKPKVFCAENAPGLFTTVGAGVRTKLGMIAEDHGYTISFYKTSCAYHGIPQNRIRTFFFMWKAPTPPMMDWFDKPHLDLEEFLARVPKDAPHQNITESRTRIQKDITYHYLKKKFEGGDFRDIYDLGHKSAMQWITEDPSRHEEAIQMAIELKDLRGEKFLRHAKMKLEKGMGFWDSSLHIFKNKINAVVGRNMTNAVHPIDDRYLTVRELMALMGLPHDFELTDIRKSNQIAQNVPANVAADMGRQCVKFCEGKLTGSGKNGIMQNNEKQMVMNETGIPEAVTSIEGFFV